MGDFQSKTMCVNTFDNIKIGSCLKSSKLQKIYNNGETDNIIT